MKFNFHINQMESREEFIKYTKKKIKHKLKKINPEGSDYNVIIYFDGKKHAVNCKISLDGSKYYNFDYYFPNDWQRIIDRISEKIELKLCG